MLVLLSLMQTAPVSPEQLDQEHATRRSSQRERGRGQSTSAGVGWSRLACSPGKDGPAVFIASRCARRRWRWCLRQHLVWELGSMQSERSCFLFLLQAQQNAGARPAQVLSCTENP